MFILNRLLHLLMVHNRNILDMFVPNFVVSFITANVANQDDGKSRRTSQSACLMACRRTAGTAAARAHVASSTAARWRRLRRLRPLMCWSPPTHTQHHLPIGRSVMLLHDAVASSAGGRFGGMVCDPE